MASSARCNDENRHRGFLLIVRKLFSLLNFTAIERPRCVFGREMRVRMIGSVGIAMQLPLRVCR
ncbi:MAG: hypothetical protein CVV16_11030 [Gammaproteobacteria bacterium HGW-Gammaproteobacteria-6]|jgi:hypothetical protein|nr:MAG: hypothetical protein CVV16_11030 [Gammaproteobacteria bacterium HGW-Gammaproteobacteria-6]